MMRTTNSAAAMAGLMLLLGSSTSPAADPASAPASASVKVQPLLTEPLASVPGKEVTMLTVEYPPGGASQPHRHDADVFVYVLKGAVLMQVDGRKPVTVREGETFHERPTDIHRQSANASTTEPAKFLVLMVKDPGKPASRPISSP